MTTFYPTEEEFALGPLPYIESITALASETGIAHIVPPASWKPPPLALRTGVDGIGEDSFTFGVRIQPTSKLCRRQPDVGAVFGFDRGPQMYRLREFAERCRLFNQTHFGGNAEPSVEEVEDAFWRIVDGGEDGEFGGVCVEYGSDLDNLENGSGFPLPEGLRMRMFEERCVQMRSGVEKGGIEESQLSWADEYRAHPWNVNNFSLHPRSALSYLVDEDAKGGTCELVSGVMVPWVYVCGLIFALRVSLHDVVTVSHVCLGPIALSVFIRRLSD